MKHFGSKAFSLLLVLVIVRVLVAQGQATPCSSTFFSALVQLIPCRLSVAPFSPIPPSEACCNALKALGQPCLCILVNGPPISGVDRNMALQLPEKCTANFEPCTLVSSLIIVSRFLLSNVYIWIVSSWNTNCKLPFYHCDHSFWIRLP